jgi:hypothetical protein
MPTKAVEDLMLGMTKARTNERTRFEADLLRALEVEREHRDLVGTTRATPLARRRFMPTPRAAVGRALATADTTPERLATVEAYYRERTATRKVVWSWLTAAWGRLGEAQWDGGGIDNPTGLLRFLNEDDHPALVSTLGDDGVKFGELAALSVWMAARDHAEWFGPIEDPDGYPERVREVTERRTHLRATLGRKLDDYESRDLHLELIDERRGLFFVGFKIAPEVPIVPEHSAGERLLDHIMARPDLIAALRARG